MTVLSICPVLLEVLRTGGRGCRRCPSHSGGSSSEVGVVGHVRLISSSAMVLRGRSFRGIPLGNLLREIDRIGAARMFRFPIDVPTTRTSSSSVASGRDRIQIVPAVRIRQARIRLRACRHLSRYFVDTAPHFRSSRAAPCSGASKRRVSLCHASVFEPLQGDVGDGIGRMLAIRV